MGQYFVAALRVDNFKTNQKASSLYQLIWGKVTTKLMSELFISKVPSLEDYWRGIILYGRNVASYKFALAKTLLELNPQAGQLIKLGELAPVFARHVF